MDTAPLAEREALAGLVERVTFHNAASGFCVLRGKVRGQRDLVTVVGAAAAVRAGKFIQASERLWAAIQGRLPQDCPTDHAGRYRALSRFRHDQRHRPA